MATNPSDFAADNLIPFARPEALADPEKLLAAYFSSSNVGLCILNRDFRYIAINSALAEINGIPAADHLGKTVREVLGEVADRLEPEFQRVFHEREPVNFEVSGTLTTRNEAGHWIVHYLPIQDASGEVTRIGVVVVEITTQKQLEMGLKDVGRKLRHEMDRLQMVLDLSSIMASNPNLQQIFPKISGPHPPRPAPRVRWLRAARSQHRTAGPPGRRLSLRKRIALIPSHQSPQQSDRPRLAGARAHDFLETPNSGL